MDSQGSKSPQQTTCLCADPSSGHTTEEGEVSLVDKDEKIHEINHLKEDLKELTGKS